jgi:hypothetical protein
VPGSCVTPEAILGTYQPMVQNAWKLRGTQKEAGLHRNICLRAGHLSAQTVQTGSVARQALFLNRTFGFKGKLLCAPVGQR